MSQPPALNFYTPKIQFRPDKMAIAIVVASLAALILGPLYGIVMHYAAAFAHGLTGYVQEGGVSKNSLLLTALAYGLWAILPLIAGLFLGLLIGQPVQQANRHPSTPLFLFLSLALLALSFLLAWLFWLISSAGWSFPNLQSLANAWNHGTPAPDPDARTLTFMGKAGYFLEPLAFLILALPGFIPPKNKSAELCATCSQPLSCLATSSNVYFARFKLPNDLPAFREKITAGDLSALGKLTPDPTNSDVGIAVFLPHCPNCPSVRLLTVEETVDINANNPEGEYNPVTQHLLERLILPPATFDKISKFLTQSTLK